ncbi:MAG: hypothetical protein JF593_02700 [Novosphingobium sp.]|nr:hypothetical protein [Novosphingobium sp.]
MGTLQIGDYVCERPGDATGPAGIHAPEEDFSVLTSSSYAVGEARGAYLRTGDRVVMTSGPKQGQKFHRVSQTFLRRVGDDGADTDLRCVRRNRNNG